VQTSSVPEYEVFIVVVRDSSIHVSGGRKHDHVADILAHLRRDEIEPVGGMVSGVIGRLVALHYPCIGALHVGDTSQPPFLLARGWSNTILRFTCGDSQPQVRKLSPKELIKQPTHCS
jgi:hypothetical protein